MRFAILLIFSLLPIAVSAEIPELEALCNKYDRHKQVKCDNVGRLMLRTYAAFLSKEDKPIFQSLDNITMLECRDVRLSEEIKREVEAALASLGIVKSGTEEVEGVVTDAYLVKRGDVILELISIATKDGCLQLSLLSGEMSEANLAKLAKMKP
jgi:hypothetical protein